MACGSGSRFSRRVLNPKLLQISLVVHGIVVKFFQRRRELFHFFLVHFDGRLVIWSEKRLVVNLLGLDISKIVPCFLDEFRLQ